MICPECNLENTAGSKFCVRCGSALPQTEPTAPSANRTNQVWNTDIDKEQNQKNSRTALMVLAVSVLLLAALCVALFVSLPSMGDILIGEREDGQSFSDRFSSFWNFFTDTIQPQPEPDRYGKVEYTVEMSEITGTADDEFITDFSALLTFTYDYCYDSIWAAQQERILLDRYCTADFADTQLQALALEYITALDDLKAATVTDADGDTYIDDHDAWNLAYNAQCLAIVQLQENYRIFPADDLHIPVFFAAYGLSSFEQGALERSLLDDLTGINALWDSRKQAYTVSLTNTSEYIADVTVYNDYETEDDWTYEEDSFHLAPGETVTIVLEEMPDDYENWYVGLYVNELYCEEDYTLYDFYWDYYYEVFTR